MANVEYWFDTLDIDGERAIVANFLHRATGENAQLNLPYEPVASLLRSKSQRAFNILLSKFPGEYYRGTGLAWYDNGPVFFTKNERGRTVFSISFTYERGGVTLLVYRLGPMRRNTGEILWLRGDKSKIPTPSNIYFAHCDHIDEEDKSPGYSFDRPFPSASQGPTLEEDIEGPLFEFSCVDRRGYFALHVDPVTSYGEAYALYERSFLVRFLSLFR